MSKSAEVCNSLVICGPSGVGKGTLISMLLSNYPDKFGLSVSYTSRKARPGEIDGVHYHFVTLEQLQADITNGLCFEHSGVHANLYGKRYDEIDTIHGQGKVCIVELDTKGVQQLKAIQFNAKYVFLTPPTIAALEARLRHRGTETEEQIVIRTHNAPAEIEYGTTDGNFDAVLINDDLQETYESLLWCVKKWFPSVVSRCK